MKLQVVITFHYNEDKLENLKRVIESVRNIKTEQTKIIVCTNQYFATDVQLDIIDRLYHPYFLAWGHKRHMIHFLDTDFTHFMYLEDDMEVTDQTMQYWLRNKELFTRNNLNFLPGIVRVEYDGDDAYCVDVINPCSTKIRPVVNIEGQEFISLSEPYQAMFIMDRNDVNEHIRSKSFMYATATPFHGAWLIQDLAAQGNMYEAVPSGFEHRYLIPVNNTKECWVHHNTDTYVNKPESQHSKLPAENLIV